MDLAPLIWLQRGKKTLLIERILVFFLLTMTAMNSSIQGKKTSFSLFFSAKVSRCTDQAEHLGSPVVLFSFGEMALLTTSCPQAFLSFGLLTTFTDFFWRNFFTKSENKISICFGEVLFQPTE